MRTKLTPEEKLEAFAFTYYHSSIHTKWQPKKGDYYTTTRADLELYKIVDEDDTHFYTDYMDGRSEAPAKWTKEEFVDPNTFGGKRLWVPEWCFKFQPEDFEIQILGQPLDDAGEGILETLHKIWEEDMSEEDKADLAAGICPHSGYECKQKCDKFCVDRIY